MVTNTGCRIDMFSVCPNISGEPIGIYPFKLGIPNIYNLTNQTFTSTTNVIYLNTLADTTVRNNTEIWPILNTIMMNYIVATTGVFPTRP